MKCTVIIDESHEEEVTIRTKKVTPKIEELINLIETRSTQTVLGYRENEISPLSVADAICFFIEDGHVFIMTNAGRFRLRERLYILEGMLPDNFVKINQSCIANMKKIEKFEASYGGSLRVIFKNGHSDYVSRRQLKQVKIRFGL